MHYQKNTTLQALINELPQIADDEGFVREIYLDSVGLPTFGVGTLITPDMEEHGQRVGTPVSDARAAEAFFGEVLHKTLGDGEAVFGESWDGFPIEAKQIFLNMLYNLGASRFRGFKKMIAAAKDHDWKVAAVEAKDSKWYRQVKTRGERIVSRLESLA